MIQYTNDRGMKLNYKIKIKKRLVKKIVQVGEHHMDIHIRKSIGNIGTL